MDEADAILSRNEVSAAVGRDEQCAAAQPSNNKADRVSKLFARFNWNADTASSGLAGIKYYRLCRDCLAHRSGRASEALAEYSKDPNVLRALEPHLDSESEGVAQFEYDDYVWIDHAQTILCSHLLREVAALIDRNVINEIGPDGMLRHVAHMTMFAPKVVRTDAYRSPEAVFNHALVSRYLVKIPDGLQPIRELKRLGLWSRYRKRYDVLYT